MAFRYRKVYVNVLTFGLFWASFHYYYGRGLESVMSLLDSARQVQSSNRQEWKTNYPWIGDPDCQHLPVQFAKNKTRPKWPLTSFPGSGVTWTRQLIEGVTGIYTGTIYGATEPPILTTGGHHGNEADINCDCTILIKDHDCTEVDNLSAYLEDIRNISVSAARREKYGNRGILLLRNPVDALFTFGHYMMAGDQKATVSPKTFRGPAWNRYVNYVAYAWAEHATRWIQNIQNGTVIFYERLLHDTEAELNRLLRAVDFVDPRHPPVDPQRMRCTLKHKNRSDRKRSKKPTIPLTAAQYSKVVASIERVQESLRKKGWPLLPLRHYNLQKQSK